MCDATWADQGAYNQYCPYFICVQIFPMRNIDLHCHSTISDGVLAPAAVAARAKANGVDVWALTDHDEVDGVAEARAAAATLGLEFVPGVEISVTWAGETVHIVGLQIDDADSALRQGLIDTRSGRQRRALEMAQQLDAVGISGAYERALKFVDNPDLMSRTHFARYIVDSGAGSAIPAVFLHYMIDGKPGFVPHRWATLADAVGWIRGAGGIAVMAHPGRYRFSELAFDALFSEFKQLGGTAIEVMTGSHTVDQYAYYAKVAQTYGFLASRGSDFHGPQESRVDLGALPPLPDSVLPVWHDWF